jgi:hypothetical protein
MSDDISQLSDADLLALAQQHLGASPPPAAPSVSAAGFGMPPVSPAEQRQAQVLVNSTKTGMASALDQVLNTPNRILNLGKAAVGTGLGLLGAPSDYMPNLWADPNFAQRGLAALGITHQQLAPQNGVERILDASGRGAGGMLMMPPSSIPQMLSNASMGALSGATGQATTEATGSPTAGMAVGMATPLVAPLAQSLSTPSLLQQQAEAQIRSQNATRDATLNAGQDLGFQVPSSAVNPNPSLTQSILESIGGKAATKQQASGTNASATNAVARNVLGVPADTPLSEQMLEDYRNQVAQPYRDVAALPAPIPPRTTGTPSGLSTLNATEPTAIPKLNTDMPIGGTAVFSGRAPQPQPPAEALHDLKQARFDASALWKNFNRTGEVAIRDQAVAASAKVNSLEDYLESVAQTNGRQDLIPALRNARTKIAQSYDIENAMNEGSGDISAQKLGNMYHAGAPLSGDLQTVAKFARAFPGYTQPGTAAQGVGVSALSPYAAAFGATTGFQAGHAMAGIPGGVAGGVLGAALPYTRGLARNIVLSPGVAQPSYAGTALANSFNLNAPVLTPALQESLLQSLMAQRSLSPGVLSTAPPSGVLTQ